MSRKRAVIFGVLLSTDSGSGLVAILSTLSLEGGEQLTYRGLSGAYILGKEQSGLCLVSRYLNRQTPPGAPFAVLECSPKFNCYSWRLGSDTAWSSGLRSAQIERTMRLSK